MSSKRHCHVMLRLTEQELGLLNSAKPAGEELAVFARRTLLGTVQAAAGGGDLRRSAAFIVAALSPDIGFEEALSLYDEHACRREEVAGERH